MKAALNTSEVAEAAGVNPQTLRYYLRRGLIHEPERTLGGQRRYPPETVTLLRMIKTAQELGFTLEEISRLHRACRRARAGDDFQAAMGALARKKLDEMEARIEHLMRIRAILLPYAGETGP